MQMGLSENRQSGKGEPVTHTSHRLPSFLSDILRCHGVDYSIIGAVAFKQCHYWMASNPLFFSLKISVYYGYNMYRKRNTKTI